MDLENHIKMIAQLEQRRKSRKSLIYHDLFLESIHLYSDTAPVIGRFFYTCSCIDKQWGHMLKQTNQINAFPSSCFHCHRVTQMLLSQFAIIITNISRPGSKPTKMVSLPIQSLVPTSQVKYLMLVHRI